MNICSAWFWPIDITATCLHEHQLRWWFCSFVRGGHNFGSSVAKILGIRYLQESLLFQGKIIRRRNSRDLVLPQDLIVPKNDLLVSYIALSQANFPSISIELSIEVFPLDQDALECKVLHGMGIFLEQLVGQLIHTSE